MPAKKRGALSFDKLEKGNKRQKCESAYTLYVSNLNTHIKPSKMKENLFILFSAFADVIQIRYPVKGLRGQGWIIVSSPDDAIKCIEKLNGFPFFENEIHVKQARKESILIKFIENSGT
ncbi:hypothetical protein CANINC_000030 [Pichia inconspicua]|uniref:RRM domain-containing protein n=1 Tax=Pichia inconspicua TaxID=52247 RepID=A0A4T0X789_9ASCO|nr:hypothetical protein CANINC_000030 [[Candida] inconspicua]